jgi:hypothetical protein
MPVSQKVEISAPNIQTVLFHITGTAPMVWCKFSEKAMRQIHETQEGGTAAKNSKKKREPKNFQEDYQQARHLSKEGWDGIPAGAFRAAMISACRMSGFAMTRAKLAVFVKADGYEETDGIPLVKITAGKPHYFESYVRLDMGSCDLRARPMWDPGWQAVVTVEYDADQMTLNDVTNLMMRVGRQVGIGEGRPDSKKSCGQGWGLFDLQAEEKKERKKRVKPEDK